MSGASAVCWRRTIAIICFFIARAASGAQASAEGTPGQPETPTAADVKALAQQVAKLAQQQEEDKKKAPSFLFQWLSYYGIRLETTTESAQTYQVEIWPVSGGGPTETLSLRKLIDQAAVDAARQTWTDRCGCRNQPKKGEQCPPGTELPPHHPLWLGRVQANKDGLSTSLEPICDDAFWQLLKRNGWVTVFFTNDDEKPKAEVRQLPVAAIERNTFAVEAGPVFSLQSDGTWKTRAEIAIAAASRWNPKLSGFVDLRYSYTAGKSTSSSTSNGAAPDPNSAGDNPFASSGGTFRGNVYGAWLPSASPSFGIIGGSGFSTVPNSGTNVKVPLRFFGGVRLEVFAYNTVRSKDFFGNASGFFQVGLARDRQWRFDETVTAADGSTSTVHHDDQNRAWLEAQIKFSDTKDSSIVYSARVFGDFPTHGSGPSDLRVSVLATIQVQRLLGFTTPSKS